MGVRDGTWGEWPPGALRLGPMSRSAAAHDRPAPPGVGAARRARGLRTGRRDEGGAALRPVVAAPRAPTAVGIRPLGDRAARRYVVPARVLPVGAVLRGR